MTSWLPNIAEHSGPRYLAIVEALRADIEESRLKDGERLPTHRDLAYRLGVTVGTVTRAYADAARRGLVRGEVGRGTYVRAAKRRASAESGFGSDGLIDLSHSFAVRPDSDALLASALQALAVDSGIGRLLDYQAHRGRPEHRAAGAAWIERHGLDVSPDQVIVTSGGQHAMAVVLGALAGPGDVVLCEELSYPGVKAVANLFRFELVGVAMDGHGILPDSLEAACGAGRAKALFCMPSLHNPTGVHMPAGRRRDVARIARDHGVAIVEDDVYGFLVEDGPAPLVSHAPEIGFFLASLSKAIAPGLRIGYAAVPSAFVERVSASVHATIYMTSPLMAELATRWIADGTGDRLVSLYRDEAVARQAIAREMLGGFPFAAHPVGFNSWVTLPEPWTPGSFVAEARQRGVVISPAEAFAIGRGAPPAVRICLSCARDRDELRRALGIVTDLARERPDSQLAVV